MPIIINWEKMEKDQGETLEAVYDRTESTRETGKIFGVSYDSVIKELDKRGIKRNGRGGANFKGKDSAEKAYEKIVAVSGYRDMNRVDLKFAARVTESQFSRAIAYKPFEYMRGKKRS